MKRWDIVLLPEVEAWLMLLATRDPRLAARVVAGIDMLADHGPALGRPLVDHITGSRLANLKELRISSVRALFVFDPTRRAVVLTIGDKRNRWREWYTEAIPTAEQRYANWATRERNTP